MKASDGAHPEATVAAPPHPDHALLAWLRAADETAFAELVRRESRSLLAVARRILQSYEEARDALQNAFLSAFRARQALRARLELTPTTEAVPKRGRTSPTLLESRAPGPFQIEPLRLEEPGRDEVLARTLASGMCNTDMVARDTLWTSEQAGREAENAPTRRSTSAAVP